MDFGTSAGTHSLPRAYEAVPSPVKKTSTGLEEFKPYRERFLTVRESNQSVISNRNIAAKLPNTWKLHSTLVSNPRVKEEVSREV